jgi:formylglycine-generating enzyme required for sulfatase activity
VSVPIAKAPRRAGNAPRIAAFASLVAPGALLAPACARVDGGASSSKPPPVPALEALAYVGASTTGEPGFLIDRFETTVARWRGSGREERSPMGEALAGDPPAVEAAGTSAGPEVVRGSGDDRPVVRVTANEAEAFAASVGGRLPTADEWERACSLPGEDDRRFPWGHAFSSLFCNSLDLGLGGPTRVGVFESGRSPWGVYDLAGNVREWTATEVRGRRIVKGGSFNTRGPRVGAVSRRPSRLEVHHREDLLEPGAYAFDLGLRVVFDLPRGAVPP